MNFQKPLELSKKGKNVNQNQVDNQTGKRFLWKKIQNWRGKTTKNDKKEAFTYHRIIVIVC